MYCRNILRKLCYWSTDSLLFFILKKCVSLLRLFRSIYFTLSRNALRDELERTCLSCRGDLWVLHENETGPLERTLELTNKFKLSTLDSKATPPIKAFRPFIWPTVIFPFSLLRPRFVRHTSKPRLQSVLEGLVFVFGPSPYQ